MFSLAIIILLAPLAAFGINIFIGKRFLPRGGDWLSLIAIWGGLILSLYLFFARMLVDYDPNFFHSMQFDWFGWGDYTLRIGITLDNVSIVMLVVVTLISALVHLYSVGYMKGDPKYSRFFAFLSLFSFSMLGLVLADNLLIIFCFWELVGLCSYLLIGFWHEKDSAANAGKKAFLANRIGDVGMLIGILLVFTTLGTLNLHEVAQGVAAGKLSGTMLTVAGLCLFCGAVGKSAQFPLHVWLPDAMEGPTPVSALIHAATMVAAGVYLLVRLFVILSFDASVVIAYVGGFTALFAATIAVAQNDIKRVLAYSTLSQLGYMVMALGVGSYTASYYHLATHAVFKACLFLCSGSVIHAMHHALHHIDSDADAQDMRNMGGIRKLMPLTFLTMLIATIALSGVPFTSGFLSKDAILGGTLAFSMIHPEHWMLSVFGFGAAILTAFYMFRLIYLTFFGEFRPGKEAASALHESPKSMTAPLVILATLSFFLFWSLPSLNPSTPAGSWFATLMPTPARAYDQAKVAHETSGQAVQHEEAIATENQGEEHAMANEHKTGATEDAHAVHSDKAHEEHIHHLAHNLGMLISIIMATLGILIATAGYYWNKIDPAVWQRRLGIVYKGMYNKWWVDEIYHYTIIGGTLLVARGLAKFDLIVIDGLVNLSAWVFRTFAFMEGWFDLHVVDGLVNLSAWIVGVFGSLVRTFQTGQLQRYVLLTILAVSLFLIISIF